MNKEVQMSAITIGKVAKETGVGIETIRFYERTGLIPEPPRRDSGYREYPQETIQRINFIKKAKELGFSLKEISELLSLSADPEKTSADVKRIAQAKISNISQKISNLQKIKKALQKLDDSCQGGEAPTSECPILEAMGGK